MAHYLRYLSIDELKEEINSRFNTAKIKMHDVSIILFRWTQPINLLTIDSQTTFLK